LSDRISTGPEAPFRRRWRAAAAALQVALALAGAGCSALPKPRTDGVETGVASWYGGEFHGRPTSSREIYDMNDMTAAHRSLPFGTYVMVTNLENDRSAVVRINDRGPFVKDRIIDLSYASARVLGIVGPGTARVRLEILRGFKAPVSSGQATVVWLQVGAFSVQENAYAVKRRLEAAYPGVAVTRLKTGTRTFFRVRIRTDEASAQGLAQRLAGDGYSVVIIRE
jgi:rare lipoprotein A